MNPTDTTTDKTPTPTADTSPRSNPKTPRERHAAVVGFILKALAAHDVNLTDAEKEGIRRCITSRGRRAGRLLKRCPNVYGQRADQMAAAAWSGIQPNRFKLGFGILMSLDGDARKLWEKLKAYRYPSWLDEDRYQLEQMGVW